MKRYIQSRKTTPKVADGRVRKKNRTAATPGTARHGPHLIRKAPRQGHWHVVTLGDVRRFLGLLRPHFWDLVQTLHSIVLAEGSVEVDATYSFAHRTIELQPWRTLVQRWSFGYVWNHATILGRLGVPMVECADHVACHFTRDTARAFMLLHVFMHELGHHEHWTGRGICAPERAESRAEALALGLEAYLWRRYVVSFGVPDPGHPPLP